ncbi:MAG: GNAT family N-acetyltransferase [Chloroflexota bacterium]|nr:GNAT family N-acetyltransferase [Chloroflexota bacterium]MDE2884022.1 GNAT family N-acetyltransferase [Chloroflexota bacterium]
MTCAEATRSFAPVRAVWRELLERLPWSTIFMTPEWQEAWWDEFGRDDELRLVTVGSADAPLGVAPLQLNGGRITFVGGTDLFDYHDFIAPDPAFYFELFDCLESEPWREMDLSSVPEWSPTFTLLPQAARERGYSVLVEEEDVVPGVTLPESWDGYLAGLRKKDRHELRRKLRRLESMGPARVRLADSATLERDLALFREVMAESREEKSEFLSPEREAFFRRVTGRMHEMGHLRLFILEIGDDPAAAAVLSFDYAGRRLLYNSGYRHAYDHLAAGLMLKALCIKDAIESGLAYFDLLRGPEHYKYHLGAVDGRIHRIVVTR